MNHSNVYLVSLIFLHQNDLGLVYKDNYHEFHKRTWGWMVSIGNQFNHLQSMYFNLEMTFTLLSLNVTSNFHNSQDWISCLDSVLSLEPQAHVFLPC